MGSVIETAATPLGGFYAGFIICGIIMMVGGMIGTALIDPERETTRLSKRAALLIEPT